MSKFKITILTILLALGLSIGPIGDAVAGEKVRGRNSMYTVSGAGVEVGDEEGHAVGFYESSGIVTVFEGESFPDKAAVRQVSHYDVNFNTGRGSFYGYTKFTDVDGDSFYMTWEAELVDWVAECKSGTYEEGIGKYEGISGEVTSCTAKNVTTTQYYSEWEAVIEFPGR